LDSLECSTAPEHLRRGRDGKTQDLALCKINGMSGGREMGDAMRCSRIRMGTGVGDIPSALTIDQHIVLRLLA
jgi:hypothetical protein